MDKAKNQNTGVCGRNTSIICLIVFADYNFFVNFDQFEYLVEKFKNDPLTLTYVDIEQEFSMKV